MESPPSRVEQINAHGLETNVVHALSVCFFPSFFLWFFWGNERKQKQKPLSPPWPSSSSWSPRNESVKWTFSRSCFDDELMSVLIHMLFTMCCGRYSQTQWERKKARECMLKILNLHSLLLIISTDILHIDIWQPNVTLHVYAGLVHCVFLLCSECWLDKFELSLQSAAASSPPPPAHSAANQVTPESDYQFLG